MQRTISRLFDTRPQAEAAVRDLEAAGISDSDISLIARHAGEDRSFGDKTEAGEGAGKGAATGGGVGAGAGLLAGLGILAIPGLGPVVAAGWLASTAVGAIAGAATGGIVGALTEAGVSKEDAPLYAEGVRRGGTLVSAKVPDADRARLESILNSSSIDLRDRSSAWKKTGWSGYDPSSPPYSADQVQKERQQYGGALR